MESFLFSGAIEDSCTDYEQNMKRGREMCFSFVARESRSTHTSRWPVISFQLTRGQSFLFN